MTAASTEAIDLGRLLLDLLIILVAARVGAELAERLRMPAVVGEMLAGVAIGPTLLDALSLDGFRGISITMLAQLGVLFLMLQVGMEMDLDGFGEVGKAAMSVAVGGVSRRPTTSSTTASRSRIAWAASSTQRRSRASNEPSPGSDQGVVSHRSADHPRAGSARR